MKYYGRLSVAALLAIAPLYGFAQEKVVPIKYGDMDQWIIRKVHESGVIGGNIHPGQIQWTVLVNFYPQRN